MESKIVTTEAPEPTGVAAWPAQVKDYFENLRMEMRRVTWPNRAQVEATTTVVILSVFAFAAYFALVDAIIGRAVTQLFKVMSR